VRAAVADAPPYDAVRVADCWVVPAEEVAMNTADEV
jgi:hypothetical protein